MDAPYDTIGRSYSTTRRADPRIVTELVRHLALPRGSVIADIGAGTGNYTNALADASYRVLAIEPSRAMRQQAKPHPGVVWMDGVAERLPFSDRELGGVVSTLAIHHFTDLRQALREMHRVSGTGPVVLFTFDYSTLDKPWQAHYFPDLWIDISRPLPPLEDIAGWMRHETGRSVEVVPFLIPHDLEDLFMLAPWRRPELYLDPQVRAGISAFALANSAQIERGLARLRDDLENGSWKEQFGSVLELSEIDAGYRFLIAKTGGQ